MATVPQFGAPEPARPYPDRPVAFGVGLREGLVALVRVEPADGPVRIDLPGGGIDPGETPEAAMAREFVEETGLEVRPLHLLTRADHFFVNGAADSFNTRGFFYAVEVLAERPERKIEADHSLFWRNPDEALRLLSRDSHAWALACWLRRA
ncbi:NUDIX domain-containing protein [Phenylobacterium sp.]|uniref:NUDIX domain-containing protein n=1 Tax=Phenylobacterium sp. TaxID=1871053 RepID=UPI00272F39AA|nr:NUDIX domain-containing protein [Phenylobacterium sp.]MDP1873375.1 NUDIX domain-containing protein [Phenylobacterium sp.]MDP3489119.1 NUDIX domain-containing protein [Phenylobacterium sp.]